MLAPLLPRRGIGLVVAVTIALSIISGRAHPELCVGIDVDHVVVFRPASAELDARERNSIDDWIKTTGLLRDKSIRRISVEIRAEWAAPGKADLDLAKQRAAAIRDFLVQRGIPSDLIATNVLGPRVSFSEARADRSRCQSYAEIRRS